MPLSLRRRLLPIVVTAFALPALAACSGSGLALTTKRVEGYVLKDEQLAQIRPGQSQDLVTIVLGSPQTTNSFGDETAFYYVETKKEATAFGMDMVKERTVLAVYFDKNKKVVDKAVYGMQDGKVFQIESRKTPSFGEDRTFIESILKSFG
jgi:outer membrane protein assembly factor BamE (lipoprotein component of BamABCDE complex)